MNKQKINVWGRDFELDVVYDCYEGEEVLSTQREALERFLTMPILISDSKKAVENYCLNRNSDEIGAQSVENIFKYVIPKSLYIQRTADDSRVVALMCAYKFDVDNGIAVVFKNERFDRVGTQNIIL
ncbi:DUF6985 domain-containing protein [Cohnella fermenti]|uniref:DUF6985 domain-containing protein n=1 Tax=Cohnella fermenti TaxID=2565925 RepID=A0A4S4BRB6_9BACL|nr:hypothetical protein [Cohnella fermenti]THF77539.1 hypothetical protein E6C55_16100 [Cohnella fermenti]